MINKAKNILIRPMEPEDVIHLERWFYSGDHDDFFLNTLALTKEQLKVYSYMKDGQGFMIWHEDKPVGFISLYEMRVVSGNLKIGILIDKEHRKSMVGYESMKMIMDYVFNQLNFVKVIAEVLVTNERVNAVICNGGYWKEATLQREANFKGKLTDVIRYCIFRDEFLNGVEKGFYI